MTRYQKEQMSDRTRWTKPQLQRMIALKQSGMTNQEIFQAMKQEFGRPQTIGEINTELYFLNKGIHPIPLLACFGHASLLTP